MNDWQVAVVTGLMMLAGSYLSYQAALRAALLQKPKISAEAKKNKSESDAVSIKAFKELVEQVQDLSNDLLEVRGQLAQLGHKYKVLWRYLLDSIDHQRKHNVKPLPVPAELQSDPELYALLTERDTKDKMKPVDGTQ